MSEKPVAERLQVKRDRRLAVLGVVGATKVPAAATEADDVLLFVRDRASLEGRLYDLLPQVLPSAILWIAYPKLTSRLAGDLNRDVIAALAPSHGLDTVNQIAIDRDWSALRVKRGVPILRRPVGS